ncbi:hypothetical protein [Paenibacillus glycanilyticus]|uniref:Uncharacterized protein n=1 Tax=Paenibacillus glycanilyticus TaxID=126569 RepID=A0ABQ6GAD6_9BACL|nr:hypothetical protein [Paenibacillus glycanilyticus]GLX66546.1 hypothetical protein MU1_08900 [Paenibacillus glycanilyticus]
MRKCIICLLISLVLLVQSSCSADHGEKIFVNDVDQIAWNDVMDKIAQKAGTNADNLGLFEFLISWDHSTLVNLTMSLIDKSSHTNYTVTYQGASDKYTDIVNKGKIENFNSNDVVLLKDIVDIFDANNISSFKTYSDVDKGFMM